MAYDLSVLDKLEQKYVREGNSLFIRTRNKQTDELVHEFEFTNVPEGPLPNEVVEVAQAIRTGLAYGATGGEVDPVSGLLISTVEGDEFAQLPVGPGPERPVRANVVPRTGTRASLIGLSGVAGEVATISDIPGVVLFNGVPNEARAIYPDNAGRTLVATTDATTTLEILVPPDVTLVVIRNTGAATRTFDNTTVAVNEPRLAGTTFRIISDASVGLVGLIDGGFTPLGASVCDFVLRDDGGLYIVSAIGLDADGSVSIGTNAVRDGTNCLLLGNKSRTSADNEIGFPPPNFAGQVLGARGHGVARLYGLTSSTITSARLTDSGVSTDPGFPLDGLFQYGLYSCRATIIAKGNNNTNFVRFVRDFVITISQTYQLAIVTPATPNNPSDIESGVSGASVAFAVDNANFALQVNVTGSTPAATLRWFAHIELIKVGNT